MASRIGQGTQREVQTALGQGSSPGEGRTTPGVCVELLGRSSDRMAGPGEGARRLESARLVAPEQPASPPPATGSAVRPHELILSESSRPTGADLAADLGLLSAGMVLDDYSTEATGEIFTPVHVPARLSSLTESGFRQAMGLGNGPAETLSTFERADAFLDRLIASHYGESSARGAEAEALVARMRSELTDLTVIIVGEDDPAVDSEHPFYVVGRDQRGDLVGLRSAVVWT